MLLLLKLYDFRLKAEHKLHIFIRWVGRYFIHVKSRVEEKDEPYALLYKDTTKK